MLEDKDLVSVQEARSLAKAAKKAQQTLAGFNKEQIEKIIVSMVDAAVSNAERLARMAVEETGFGKVEDKILKNLAASRDLYEFIKDMNTIGVIKNDTVNKVIEIAEPMGVVVGIVPSTNPTSTAIFKSIVSIKSRNGIVISPHPSAVKCTNEAARIMSDAAVKAGAPEGIIGYLTNSTLEATNELMTSSETSIILATGGPGMVKAAYSAGKPALGVGPGNVPVYIERSADIKKAVKDIITGKTFDNSTICASEQAIIVEECIREEVIREFKALGAYFMTPDETEIVGNRLITPSGSMDAAYMGRSAEAIAKKTGLSVPPGTTVLIGEQSGVGKGYPLSYEKLTCVLAFYTVNDWEEACELCIKLLNNGGVGHSMCIHSQNEDIIMKFTIKPVFRILVNVPASLGAVGVLTGLAPSFTLGCGTWGGSSTSDNVTPMHLLNIKRVAYGIRDFKREPAVIGKSAGDGLKGEELTEADIARIVGNVTEQIISQLKNDKKKINIGVSNRHVHLSERDRDTLFGTGFELTKMKDLIQPGQFACNEVVTITGPKGEIENVRILGPERKQTQVEISKSDGIKLGINAPLRESGDLEGSSPITVNGPKGEVALKEGAITALRHIHFSVMEAKEFGVRDGQVVSVRVNTPKGGTLDNVLVRSGDAHRLEMHIDTDEANALGIGANHKAELIL